MRCTWYSCTHAYFELSSWFHELICTYVHEITNSIENMHMYMYLCTYECSRTCTWNDQLNKKHTYVRMTNSIKNIHMYIHLCTYVYVYHVHIYILYWVRHFMYISPSSPFISWLMHISHWVRDCIRCVLSHWVLSFDVCHSMYISLSSPPILWLIYIILLFRDS